MAYLITYECIHVISKTTFLILVLKFSLTICTYFTWCTYFFKCIVITKLKGPRQVWQDIIHLPRMLFSLLALNLKPLSWNFHQRDVKLDNYRNQRPSKLWLAKPGGSELFLMQKKQGLQNSFQKNIICQINAKSFFFTLHIESFGMDLFNIDIHDKTF